MRRPRPISTRLHGILDYLTAATLQAVPAALGTGGTTSGRILRAAGINHAAYSAVTDYELGVARKLPMRAHLAIDTAGAAGLLSAPWLLGLRRRGARHWVPLVAFGAYELAAVALSDQSPPRREPAH